MPLLQGQRIGILLAPNPAPILLSAPRLALAFSTNCETPAFEHGDVCEHLAGRRRPRSLSVMNRLYACLARAPPVDARNPARGNRAAVRRRDRSTTAASPLRLRCGHFCGGRGSLARCSLLVVGAGGSPGFTLVMARSLAARPDRPLRLLQQTGATRNETSRNAIDFK